MISYLIISMYVKWKIKKMLLFKYLNVKRMNYGVLLVNSSDSFQMGTGLIMP